MSRRTTPATTSYPGSSSRSSATTVSFDAATTLFGHEYAVPRIEPGGARPVVIMQAEHVPIFRALHPDCVTVLLTAPVPVLIERIRGRGDLDRIRPEAFEDELRLGRAQADLVVDASASVEDAAAAILAGLP